MLKSLALVSLFISFQVSAQSEAEQIQDARKKSNPIQMQLEANQKHNSCFSECSASYKTESSEHSTCVDYCLDDEGDQPSKGDRDALDEKIIKMRNHDLKKIGCAMSDDEQTISCSQGEYVKKPSTLDNIRKVVEKPHQKSKAASPKSSKTTKK